MWMAIKYPRAEPAIRRTVRLPSFKAFMKVVWSCTGLVIVTFFFYSIFFQNLFCPGTKRNNTRQRRACLSVVPWRGVIDEATHVNNDFTKKQTKNCTNEHTWSCGKNGFKRTEAFLRSEAKVSRTAVLTLDANRSPRILIRGRSGHYLNSILLTFHNQGSV